MRIRCIIPIELHIFFYYNINYNTIHLIQKVDGKVSNYM